MFTKPYPLAARLCEKLGGNRAGFEHAHPGFLFRQAFLPLLAFPFQNSPEELPMDDVSWPCQVSPSLQGASSWSSQQGPTHRC